MAFDFMQFLGLGKKGASTETYTTPPSADYTALIGKLQGIGDTGFPEMEQWGKNYYNQQLLPDIRESYEAKRNPYGGGFADTPEAMQFAKGAQGVTSDVATANMNARMQAMQMLSGLVNKPQQMTTYQQEYNPVQDLLTGGLGLGSNLLGTYLGSTMQTKALKDAFSGMGGGGSGVAGTKFGGGASAYDQFYDEQQPDYLGMGLDAASMMPGPQQPFVYGANMLSKLFRS